MLTPGLRVEWRNSFRDFEGVIVRNRIASVEAFEFTDIDVYEFGPTETQRLVVRGTAVPQLVKYYRKDFSERAEREVNIIDLHSHIIAQLSSIQADDEELRDKLLDALDEEKKLLKKAVRAAARDTPSTQGSRDSRRSKRKGKKSPVKLASKAHSFKNSARRQFNGDGKEDENEVYEDDFETLDDENGDSENANRATGPSWGKDSRAIGRSASTDGGHEQDDATQDDDEDEDEEDEEEDEEEDDEDEEEDEDDEDEEEDEEDDEEESDSGDEQSRRSRCTVNAKVVVLPLQVTRGFTLSLDKRGLSKLHQQLRKDYNASFRLFLRDEEGDVITILSPSDLQFAYRTSRASRDMSGKHGSLTLKLLAEYEASQQDHGLFDVRKSGEVLGLRSSADRLADLPPASIPPSSFDVLWQRGELLGTGSFGKVFAGINLTTGERMAVKEVRFGQDPRSMEQARALQREVHILSSLRHDHIIRYMGTEMAPGVLRIFLEFATDGTLKDAVRQFGPLPEPLLRVYTVEILEGLVYLHSLKMIHRDIKPANVLLSNGKIKLADFGCASGSLLREEDGNASDTNHHTIVGTTLYMAPEVMRAGEAEEGSGSSSGSNKDVDAPHRPSSPHPKDEGAVKEQGVVQEEEEEEEEDERKRRVGYGRKADIWSLGMTLQELSVGSPCYRSPAAAIYAVCVTKKVPLFPGHFSETAHHFLSRCLEFHPPTRASAQELRQHSFCVRPGLDEARAQTASSQDGRRPAKMSTVKVNLSSEVSWTALAEAKLLPSDQEEEERGERGGEEVHGRGARQENKRTDLSWKEDLTEEQTEWTRRSHPWQQEREDKPIREQLGQYSSAGALSEDEGKDERDGEATYARGIDRSKRSAGMSYASMDSKLFIWN